MLNKYFAFLFLIIFSFTYGQCCRVSVREPYPLFSKRFGSKNVTFRAKEDGIYLSEGEEIEIYCGNGIKFYSSDSYSYSYDDSYDIPPNGLSTAKISCNQRNQLFVGEYNPIGETETVSCQPGPSSSSSLYEIKKKLPNCENFQNYAIAERTPFVGTIIKSTLCYDFESLSLKYVRYVAYKEDKFWFNDENTSHELGDEVEQKVANLGHYFDFMSENSFNNSRDEMQRSNTFFKDFAFDFTSILQDARYGDEGEKNEFAYIFNVMWWRSLRQNNWRFFLDALKERTKTAAKYLVTVGYYGNATMPIRGNAAAAAVDARIDLSVRSSSNLVATAPAYIWAYLKSLNSVESDHSNVVREAEEEFVVIAHNTPFAIAPSHSDFCTKDICDDIAWLHESEFGRLRRIPTFGYMFCCRAKEVAEIIAYFPLAKQTMETTTTIKSNVTEAY